MNDARKISPSGAKQTKDRHVEANALQREITCLERQVSRIRLHSDHHSTQTIKTYEEMIESRRSMLYTL